MPRIKVVCGSDKHSGREAVVAEYYSPNHGRTWYRADQFKTRQLRKGKRPQRKPLRCRLCGAPFDPGALPFLLTVVAPQGVSQISLTRLDRVTIYVEVETGDGRPVRPSDHSGERQSSSPHRGDQARRTRLGVHPFPAVRGD